MIWSCLYYLCCSNNCCFIVLLWFLMMFIFLIKMFFSCVVALLVWKELLGCGKERNSRLPQLAASSYFEIHQFANFLL